MKKITGLILALVFTLSTTIVEAYNKEPDNYFTVQIGSFTSPKAKDFKMLKDIGAIYLEHPKGSKLKRVLLGKYKEKAAANATLAKIKAKGFQDAFIAARPVKATNKVWVVQLASYNWGESIDLKEWTTSDKLLVQLIDNEVKIVSGLYPNFKVAAKKLAAIRADGYPNAFMNEVSKGWLMTPSQFESDYIHLHYNPALAGGTPKGGGDPEKKKGKKATNKKPIKGSTFPSKKKEREVPTSYGKNTVRPKGGTQNLMPNFLNKKQRNSVLELQKVLKSEKNYAGSLDGLNGNGTQNGVNNFIKNNERYQRYAALTKAPPVKNEMKGGINSLDYNMDLVEVNPNMAASNLKDFDNPLADVFLAYLYLTEKVKIADAQLEINDLMNGAISRAFKNYKGESRFDYNATYAYKKSDQLLQHMAYIYEVTPNPPAIPCWMFKEHNVELTKAFTGLKTPKFAECGGFTDWREVRMLVAMAEDLDPLAEEEKPKSASAEKQAYITKRTELFVAPKKPSNAEVEILDKWNKNLWTALDKWSTTDPLHQKMVVPFKVAYYNTYDKLENHYARKGFTQLEAKGLALMTLRSFVNYHLNSYMSR